MALIYQKILRLDLYYFLTNIIPLISLNLFNSKLRTTGPFRNEDIPPINCH